MKKFLQNLWAGWKRIAHVIGRFQTRVLVGVAYLIILSPLGFFGRLVGWDPLEINRKNLEKKTSWKPVRDQEPDLESMQRQS